MTARAAEKTGRGAVLRLALTALFAALTALCAWIQIPLQVPFTMQCFAVFAALLFLGGKYGTLSFLVYVLLGAVGAPVFSGFRGGAGVLLGVTGGYITGFGLGCLAYWAVETACRRRAEALWPKIVGLSLCLLLCYAFGTLWFAAVHEKMLTPAGLASAFSVCVLPFILPDALKLALAVLLWRRLSPRLPAI